MRGSAYGTKSAGADLLYPRSLLQSARGCSAVRVPRYPRRLVTSARRGEPGGLARTALPLGIIIYNIRLPYAKSGIHIRAEFES